MWQRDFFGKLLMLVALAAPASAGIVEDVRTSLAQNSFSSAEAALNSYRTRSGVTPEYVEAYSWMARAALGAHEYDQAAGYAKQTRALAADQLKQRPLDAEPHLPIALGAAIEVEAQAMAARGQRTQAAALLQSALRTYGNTSIRARLQKNLNLLSFEGRPAPSLRGEQFLGSKPPALQGLQRQMRPTPLHAPRTAPYLRTAPMKYSLQLGSKRQACPYTPISIGDTIAR